MKEFTWICTGSLVRGMDSPTDKFGPDPNLPTSGATPSTSFEQNSHSGMILLIQESPLISWYGEYPIPIFTKVLYIPGPVVGNGISEPSKVDSIYILCDDSACSAIPLLDSSHRHREGHSFRFQAFLLVRSTQLNEQLQVIGTLPECAISEAQKASLKTDHCPTPKIWLHTQQASMSRNKYPRPTELFHPIFFRPSLPGVSSELNQNPNEKVFQEMETFRFYSRPDWTTLEVGRLFKAYVQYSDAPTN